MRTPRGGVAAQQDLVGRVREQKRRAHGKLLDIKEHFLPLACEIGLTQVHAHGQPGVVLGRRVEEQLNECRGHAGGQPVHAEKTHVLEDPERRAFAGPGHARDDDYVFLFGLGLHGILRTCPG
jgi:hypothetical protein